MGMHTLILGAGALGSILAAYLARAGERVTLVARGARADILERDGVSITGLETFSARVAIVRSIREVPEADLVVLATKTYDTASVLEGAAFTRSPVAFSIQNGLQKDDDLARLFSRAQVLGAAANFSGEVLADGRALFSVHDSIPIGELDGSDSQRVRDIARMFQSAGIKVQASTDIRSIEWTKLAVYASVMAPSVLCRAPTWKYASDPDTAIVMARIVKEIGEMAGREGAELRDEGMLPVGTIYRSSLQDAAKAVQTVGERFRVRAPDHKVSALQDLERGRRLEHEATLGFVVRQAAVLALDIPVVETCFRQIAMIDRSAQADRASR